MSFDWKLPTALVIGRFQPPHISHLTLVVRALEMEGQVCIGVREPLLNTNNPFDFEEVERRWKVLLTEQGLLDRVIVMNLPNITNVVYGRDVGYKITRVELGPELESISATKIRQTLTDNAALHNADRDAEIRKVLEGASE